MAIVLETSGCVCKFCGDGDDGAGMYRCDICGAIVCGECLPILDDDDCPNEFCEDCIGPPTGRPETMSGAVVDWKPFEPAVMDNLLILADGRTVESPCAMLIDAIATKSKRHGAKRASHEDARWNLECAISELSPELSPGCQLPSIGLSLLRCLFALRVLRYAPVILVPPGEINENALRDGLRAALKAADRKEFCVRTIEAIGHVAGLFPPDKHLDHMLNRLRGWAWSSNIPGIIVYVDIKVYDFRKQTQQLLAFHGPSPSPSNERTESV